MQQQIMENEAINNEKWSDKLWGSQWGKQQQIMGNAVDNNLECSNSLWERKQQIMRSAVKKIGNAATICE